MKNIIKISILLALAGLNACATVHELRAPCPDYGRYCSQTPINSENSPEDLF